MLRRAGFQLDDQSVYLAISEIEAGRPAIVDTWGRFGQYLKQIMETLTEE